MCAVVLTFHAVEPHIAHHLLIILHTACSAFSLFVHQQHTGKLMGVAIFQCISGFRFSSSSQPVTSLGQLYNWTVLQFAILSAIN